MRKVAFFDTKSYDKKWFDKYKGEYDIEIKYFSSKLNSDTAVMASGYQAVCAFVNDEIGHNTIKKLAEQGIGLIAMRCAGYNNVDIKDAKDKVRVVRVPEYSPWAVAEHTAALLFSLNRKIHRAYQRTRDFNFSLIGLQGRDLNKKTVGVIGTGRIGKCFINICKGIGMKILAYDKYPDNNLDGVEYVSLDRLFKESDVISLHCPLTNETYHMLDNRAFEIIKDDAIIINTSRGALINTEDLVDAIVDNKVGGAALDVYEEEMEFFYEDKSDMIIKDEVLTRLISFPNVLVTSHQAFLTDEALENIAKTTLSNISEFFDGKILTNEVE